MYIVILSVGNIAYNSMGSAANSQANSPTNSVASTALSVRSASNVSAIIIMYSINEFLTQLHFYSRPITQTCTIVSF